MLVARPMISAARNAVTTKPMAASRDWPVTMRYPWNMTHSVNTVKDTMPIKAEVRCSSVH
ncbi:hypothetical protein SM19410_14940 [Xanthomonas hortorum pv. gardneri]|uniref:Uncharacterized protein n=1 Tax=Xanthomonas hortorum pv. gardneri TaxID=2754056 RepID=A0A6V7CUW6_9XANT|nr:hypothetical protein XGA_4269 [Xanthomonas hortorum ATCC 19865]KLA95665.1 hypothetical protein SM19410_14940 [Xanthomonas hortorum pv. gardneri]KLB04532.1 hypothetical protein SM23410_22440 [Xanthomonas hortorum pv. gardneri]KLB05031.1 hypothetical protein SM22010_21210 [Xanthomonas hortorum pv. gardneri]KLB13104.1 hypothetical protein SM40611_20920 [Xanthomonas hortorum pv. gardneri]